MVTDVQACKQAEDVRGTLKCQNPGNCPGQAQKILHFKNAGCTDVIIGNCSDCTNTVMGSAPKMNLNVHHQTDHIFETVGMEPMRYLTKSKVVEQLPVDDKGRQLPFPKEEEKTEQAVEQEFSFSTMLDDGLFHIHVEEGQDIHIEFS